MGTTKTATPKKPRAARAAAAVQRMERTGPSRAALRRLVKKSRPPQSWYEEGIDPFKPASK